MDDMVILGVAASAKSLAEQNATAIEALKGGMKYKGAVADYAHLPATGNKAGDVWSTLDDGCEYVWGNVGGTNQWIQLGTAAVEPLTEEDIDYCLADKYTITETVVNAAADPSNPTEIVENKTATLVYTFDGEDYICPDSVTVTGATGTWTKDSDTHGTLALSNPTTNVSVTVEGEAVPIVTGVACTVSNLGSSNPSSVTFVKNGEFTKAGLGIEEVTLGTDVFVKIPTMYRKVNTVVDNQITSFTIANAKADNDFVPYSCFIDENGNELPYILIGKYWNTQANGCVSTTEAAATNVTTAVGRANAKARGTGYQLFDWQMQKLWQDLIICFKETVNTNSGTAWTYDELGIYWATSGGWIDGVMGSSRTWKLCTKPSKYASLASESNPVPNDYVSAGYSQPTSDSMEIQKLGYDSNNPFFSFPSAVTSNSSYDTYYCDSYYYNSGNRPVFSLVGYASAAYGAFYCAASSGWSTTLGVRLCYRPLSA